MLHRSCAIFIAKISKLLVDLMLLSSGQEEWMLKKRLLMPLTINWRRCLPDFIRRLVPRVDRNSVLG